MHTYAHVMGQTLATGGDHQDAGCWSGPRWYCVRLNAYAVLGLRIEPGDRAATGLTCCGARPTRTIWPLCNCAESVAARRQWCCGLHEQRATTRRDAWSWTFAWCWAAPCRDADATGVTWCAAEPRSCIDEGLRRRDKSVRLCRETASNRLQRLGGRVPPCDAQGWSAPRHGERTSNDGLSVHGRRHG